MKSLRTDPVTQCSSKLDVAQGEDKGNYNKNFVVNTITPMF